MPKLPQLSPEDIEKVKRLKGETAPISREMYFLAEFGYYFGWPGIVAIETEVISLDKAQKLLEATRKVHNDKMYEQSKFDFYASKGAKDYNTGIKKITINTRVD